MDVPIVGHLIMLEAACQCIEWACEGGSYTSGSGTLAAVNIISGICRLDSYSSTTTTIYLASSFGQLRLKKARILTLPQPLV